jgi:hypothetical protein
MKESRESASHFYAKYMLARMLDKIHEGDNCFHVVEYPIIEHLEFMSFDEHYSIRKKDKAVVSIDQDTLDREPDKYESVDRVYPGIKDYKKETTFNNLNMPTLKNYIDGGVKVKYFVDVAQIWKGALNKCFEIKNKNPVDTEKLDYLGNIECLNQDIYEISSRYLLGFDIRKPNLKKLKREFESKHRIYYKEHTRKPKFDQATMSILGGRLHSYNKTSWRVDEYYR